MLLGMIKDKDKLGLVIGYNNPISSLKFV